MGDNVLRPPSESDREPHHTSLLQTFPGNQSLAAQTALLKDDAHDMRRNAVAHLLSQLAFPQPSISPLDSPSDTTTPQQLVGQLGGVAPDIRKEDPDNQEAESDDQEEEIDIEHHLAILRRPMEDLFPKNPPSAAYTEFHEREQDKKSIKPLKEKETLLQQGYAKVDFDDGCCFITFSRTKFGRDLYRLHQAEQELAKQASRVPNTDPSTNARSHPSGSMHDAGGSVVSGAGGFAGVDGDVPGNLERSHGSSSSNVDPKALELPVLCDYEQAKRNNDMFRREKARKVTTDHLPREDDDLIPLIPIHARTNTLQEEIQSHKSISREHVEIYWDLDLQRWRLYVEGRNGAFLNGTFLHHASDMLLNHGDRIQVKEIDMVFCLPPSLQTDQTPYTPNSDNSDDEEDRSSNIRSTTEISAEEQRTATPAGAGRKQNKVAPKNAQSVPLPALAGGLTGQSMPPKKRGPGRPPKDGVSSTREKKEIAKRQKELDAKAANGGVTPPPSARGRLSQPVAKPLGTMQSSIPEKRKYNKRKTEDDVLPSIEDEEDIANDREGVVEEGPASKRAKKQKSESPPFPPKSSFTEEQLAKPSEPYSQQLYKLLSDIHPRELSLKGIYSEMRRRWPYYQYGCESNGWESSVRHNLNNHQGQSFLKGKREGKGHTWKAALGVPPKADKDKKAPVPPTSSVSNPRPRSDPVNRQQNYRASAHQAWGPPPTGVPPSVQYSPQGQGMMYGPPGGPTWYPNGITPSQPMLGGPSVPANGQNSQFVPQRGHHQPFQTPPNVPVPQAFGTQMSQPPIQPSSSQGMPQQNQPPLQQGTPAQVQLHSNFSKPPQPPPSTTKSRAAYIPCTYEGFEKMNMFREAYFQEPAKSNLSARRSQRAFMSARNRAAHGSARLDPEPEFAEGKEKMEYEGEEGVIYKNLMQIVKMHPNPEFKGYEYIIAAAREPADGNASRPESQDVPQVNTPTPPLDFPGEAEHAPDQS